MIPALGRLTDVVEPLAWPLVRVACGAFLIPHGWMKAFGGRLDGTADYLATIGMEPALPLAVLAMLVELVGGALLVLGLLTRAAAASVVGFMAVAAFVIHWPNGFFWPDGGWEYPAFWGLVALAILVRGGGRLSLDRLIGREL